MDQRHLEEVTFSVVTFNVACEAQKGRFVPNEVAVVKCSIRSGINSAYHAFVDSAGSIPLGCRASARDRAEVSHNIPWRRRFVLSDDDFEGILRNLYEFSGDESGFRAGGDPILFALNKDSDLVESCLTFLDGFRGQSNFEVLPLDTLFYYLQTAFAESGFESGFQGRELLPFANPIQASDCLRDDPFTVSPAKLCCEFHFEIDNDEFCALSCAARLAYCVFHHLNLRGGVGPGGGDPPGGGGFEPPVGCDEMPEWRRNMSGIDEEVLIEAVGQAEMKPDYKVRAGVSLRGYVDNDDDDDDCGEMKKRL